MITNNNPWPKLLIKYISFVLIAALIGWAFDYAVHAAFIALLIIVAWNLSRLYTLDQWLRKSRMINPPESTGIWGEIFDQIYRLRKRDKKRSKNLSKIVKRFESSALALPDGVIGINENSEMEWWNDTASQLLGLKKGQDKGQRIDNLIRTPEFVQYYQDTQHEKPIHVPSPANKAIVLEIRVVGYGLKDQIIIVRDISEPLRVQQMRKDFVANVSHELRTPLTVLNGTAELFDDTKDELPEQFHKPIELMNQQTKRMTSIVNDLLTLSKLESGHNESSAELIDIETLLRLLKTEAKALSGDLEQNIIIETDKSLSLYGNVSEITSCFTNLISNAIRHTPPNGAINIRWHKNGGDPCFEVQDNGFGIAPEHISRLTERFYRVDAGRSRNTGGTGLGLSIVKRILLRHNATLEIESDEGIGSTFRCRFKTS